MSEFLEILSPGALEELKQVQTLVKSLATDIKSINNFKTSSTPSGADENIKKLNIAYKEQSDKLKIINQQVNNLYNSYKKEEELKQKQIATQIKLNSESKSSISLREAERKATIAQTKEAEKEAKAREKAAAAQTELSRAYVQLVAKQQQAKKVLQDLVVTQGKNSAATKRAQKEYDTLTAKVNLANKATSNFSKTGLGSVARGLSNLMGAFGVVGGVYLFAGLIKSGFELTRKLDSLNYTMKAVIENEEILKQTQLFLTETADKYGASIVTLTERYNKFYTAARQSGVSLEDTEAIFQSFTKSAGFLGLKSHELEGIFLALEQMLSKGKVTTEELRRQLGERLPGAFGVMADTVNKLNPDIEVTVQVLDDMLKKGEVLSAEVLPEFAKQYEQAIGIVQKERVETLNASIERMTNSWVSFIGSVSTGDGVLSKVLRSAVDYVGLVVKGLDFLAKGDSQIQAERNYSLYSKILTTQADQYKELGEEANAYAKIDSDRAKKSLESLKAEKKQQDAIAEVQAKKLGVLKYSNKAYNSAIDKSDLLSASIAREEAVLLAATRQLEGYVEATDESINKGRTLADVLSDISDAQEELKNSTQDEAPNILDKIDALNKEKEAWERLNNAKNGKRENIEPLEDITVKTTTYRQEIEKLIDILQKAQDLEIKGSKTYNELQKSIDNLTIALDPLTEANKKANSEIESFIEATKREEEELRKLKSALDDFRDGFTSDFFSDTGFDFTGKFLMNFDEMEAMLKAGGNQWEDYFNLISEMAQEAYNFIASASQQNFDAEYSRLEKQRDIAIQFAGESDAAKERIEEQYEARKAAIQSREAKAQKEMAIINATINTAQAVVSVLAQEPGGLIKKGIAAAIVGAIGAAQIALIASQQIPEYFIGTDNADSGLAWTQERGSEIITDKRGVVKDFGDSKGARLTMMAKGDKVYTADQTRKMMFNNELNGILSSNGISNSDGDIKIINNGLTRTDLDQVMSKHFSNIQTNQTTIDKNGLNTYVKKQNSKTTSLNNRVSFKGFSV
jgi:tape measure domain-containing protein